MSEENVKKETCERCGYEMDNLSACHLRCSNCGVEYDCSDKGTTW